LPEGDESGTPSDHRTTCARPPAVTADPSHAGVRDHRPDEDDDIRGPDSHDDREAGLSRLLDSYREDQPVDDDDPQAEGEGRPLAAAHAGDPERKREHGEEKAREGDTEPLVDLEPCEPAPVDTEKTIAIRAGGGDLAEELAGGHVRDDLVRRRVVG